MHSHLQSARRAIEAVEVSEGARGLVGVVHAMLIDPPADLPLVGLVGVGLAG